MSLHCEWTRKRKRIESSIFFCTLWLLIRSTYSPSGCLSSRQLAKLGNVTSTISATNCYPNEPKTYMLFCLFKSLEAICVQADLKSCKILHFKIKKRLCSSLNNQYMDVSLQVSPYFSILRTKHFHQAIINIL